MLVKILFLAWFFTLNLGQLSALSKTSLGGVYLFDLFSILWSVFATTYIFISKKNSFEIPKRLLILLAFIFIAFVSLLGAFGKFSTWEILFSSFYLIRLLSYVIGGIVVYIFLKSELFTMDFLYKLIAFSVIFISLGGFIQLIVLPDFSVLDQSLGWDPHKNRLASTFFDPNFTGAYLVLCFNFLMAGREFLKGKFLPLMFLIVLSILFTFSRSAWLMFSVSIFVWGALKYPKFLLVSLFLAFSAYFAVPRIQTRISGITDPADSAHFRFISWNRTLEIAKDNLFLGTGFNTFRFVQKNYGYFGVDLGGHSGAGSDSSFLLVLATTGIIGLISFLGFFFSLFLEALKNPSKTWSITFIASMSGLFIESFFINSIFYPQIMFLWIIISVGFIFNLSYK